MSDCAYFCFVIVNRAVAQYAVDSLKDMGVCRICPDCVNGDIRVSPSSKPVSSAPSAGREGMVLLTLMYMAASILC